MSHFTVLVIGDNPDKQLSPFQENNMEDCPPEYLQFHDLEAEYKEEFEDGTQERYVGPDGKHYSQYDDMFYREPTPEEQKEIGIGGSGWTGGKKGFSFSSKDWGDGKGYRAKVHYLPEGFHKEDLPIRNIYASFDEYVQDWHGSSKRDPQMNRYGYWENPNAKWDWYQIGGRWSGFFKLKTGKNGIIGKPGVFDNIPEEGYVDQCRKGDVDWEGIKEDARQKATERYNKYEKYFKDFSEGFQVWKTFVKKIDNKEIDIEEARKQYHDQSLMKHRESLSQSIPDNHPDREFIVWTNLDKFVSKSRETYIEEAALDSFQTFAVVKDGKWYERGQMGWWAMVSNEKDEEEWERQFAQLLNDLSDDTLLTLVDCHI